MSESILAQLMAPIENGDVWQVNPFLRSIARRNNYEKSTVYELRNAIMMGLHSVGVMELQIEYHGGGDSGDIEEVTWYPNTIGLDALQATHVEITRYFEGWANKVAHCYFVGETVTLKEAVDSFFWTIVSTYFPGWEINEGGSGMIAFDLTDNTVTLYHTTYYQSSQEDIVEL